VSGLLKSRKFWLTVAAVVSVVARDKLGLSEEQVQQIVLAIAALIFGIAYEDGQAKSANGGGMPSGGKA
jgi:hypothetical protein